MGSEEDLNGQRTRPIKTRIGLARDLKEADMKHELNLNETLTGSEYLNGGLITPERDVNGASDKILMESGRRLPTHVKRESLTPSA